jgi:hypothetical protein
VNRDDVKYFAEEVPLYLLLGVAYLYAALTWPIYILAKAIRKCRP